METFFVWVVSLGAGFFMCLLLMALFTLLVRRRTRQVKRLNSRQVSWVPSSLLVKRNKWLMVQHERRQNLDLTSSCPQTSQSLGSLACPYANTGRSSSQNDDNYSTRNGMGIDFGNQNNNMGFWVKEEPPSSSSLSLCHYLDTSSSLTLTTAATSCTALPLTPNTHSFTLNEGSFSDKASRRLRPLPELPLPARVREAPSLESKPIPALGSLEPDPFPYYLRSSSSY